MAHLSQEEPQILGPNDVLDDNGDIPLAILT